jgi:hypothetical protein
MIDNFCSQFYTLFLFFGAYKMPERFEIAVVEIDIPFG